MGGIEVAEAVKVIMGKKPSLSDKILHVDIETMDFTSTRTFRAEECPICGTGKLEETVKKELILEELCGRNQGKRTFSITPTSIFDLDIPSVTAIAKSKGLLVDNSGELGLSLRNNDYSVSFMKKGSAVIVGSKDEADAISLYKELLA
jgi:adenylyltransferase/sulfurtransferase